MGLFDSIGKSLGVSGGDLFGGVMELGGSYYQNKEAKKAAQRQMDFQERMSNTAYQRSMGDMRAAGLNPMLAMKLGGASTPTGAMYNPQNIGAAAVEGYSKVASAKMANAQVQTQNATAKGLQIDNEIKERTLQDLEKRGTTIEMYRNRWDNLAGSEVYAAITKNLTPEDLGNYLVKLLSADFSGAADVMRRATNNPQKNRQNMELNQKAIDIIKRGKASKRPQGMKQHYSYSKDNVFAYEYKKYQYGRNNR